MVDYTTLADWGARALGLALCGQGMSANFDTVNSAQIFGISYSTAENTLFFPVIGLRNATCGLLIIATSLMGYRQMAGVLLVYELLCGMCEIAFVRRRGGTGFPQALGGVFLGLVSWGLLRDIV